MVSPVAGSGAYYLVGFQGVFWLMTGLFVIAVPVIFCSLGPDRAYRSQGSSSSKPCGLLFRPRILSSSLCLSYSMAAIGYFDASIAPHLLTFGLTQIQIGGQ